MKVIGLDGRQHKWPPTGCIPAKTASHKRSMPHLKARALLKQLYPTLPLLEEVPIPGSRLRLDFFLPFHKLVIEVQGIQHNEFNSHFHRNMLGFVKSQQRDNTKREWCEDNGIQLIELMDGETDDKWKARIMG